MAAINPEFKNSFTKSHSTAENHPILLKLKKSADEHVKNQVIQLNVCQWNVLAK
jgi:hypothetical protein